MQSTSKLHDERYRNWVRGALGLMYLQEGLQIFTDGVVQEEQTRILQKAGKCSNCTTEEILPSHAAGKLCIQKSRLKCNCKIKKNRSCSCCSNIYDEIILQHRFRDPSWETDSRKWCTDHWQIAKCFLVTTSKGSNNTAFETDAAGLLSIIVNGLFFQTVLQCSIDPPNDIFSKTRAARNEILHNARQQLTDCEVTNYIQLMIDVLQDNSRLLNDKAAVSAVKNLKEIQSDKLTISTEVETKAIKAALAVIKLAEEETKECLKAATDENQKMIEEQKIKALEVIKTAEVEAVSHVQKDVSIKFDEDFKPDLKQLKQVKDDHENRLKAIEVEIRDKTSEEQHKRRLSYLRKKNELKEDLILFNKQHHSTIPYSLVEDDAPLEDLYVFPEMNCIEIQKSVSSYHRPEMRSSITNLRDVFCKKSSNIRLKEIYVLSEAGMGKSAFGKLLAVTWCYSHKPDQDKGALFEEVNLQFMHEFEFLFLVSLRDFRDSISDVDQMIMHQIISNLSRSSFYTTELLQDVLHKEICLIILDGLDEWSAYPSDIQIPRRKAREHCSILTTSRTWKFSALTLSISEKDRTVEITGLNKGASERLVRNVLSKLRDDNDQSIDIEEFFQKLEFMNIKELIRIPMILLYLVSLWHDDRSVGRTKCEVYSNMIEYLLSHAEKKRRDIFSQNLFEDKDYNESKLPECFEENEYCRKYCGLLEKLANLAFQTLFGKTQELAIVFNSSKAKQILSESGLDFSLTVGLLSKSKIPGKLAKREFKVFFPHKTFQEYFAAFHIHFNPDAIAHLKSECKSVESLLSMSNVFIFLSGLCPEAINKLSEGIKDVIGMDSVTQSYRCDALSFKCIYKYNDIVKRLLNLHLFCIQENFVSEQHKVHLHFEDFIIDDAADQENITYALKELMKMNITRLKSLKIETKTKRREMSDIVDTFGLNEIHTLERLDYWGAMEKETVYTLLCKSMDTLKSLTIHGVEIQLPFNPIAKYISLSMQSLDTLKAMANLETISLWCIKLNHVQLGELLKSLSKKHTMRYIGLQEVLCSEHMEICDGFSFDLSNHERLEVINIGQIPLSSIEINTSAIEECRIVPFPKSEIVSDILKYLPEADKLETFVCHYLKDDHDIENVINAIPNLKQLKRIRFLEIDFGPRDKILPDKMEKFEFLCLVGVTMNCLALKNIIAVINNYTQLVEIQLQYCNFIPPGEYEQVKENVRKSDMFEVVLDGKNSKNAYEFTFKKMCDNQTVDMLP